MWIILVLSRVFIVKCCENNVSFYFPFSNMGRMKTIFQQTWNQKTLKLVVIKINNRDRAAKVKKLWDQRTLQGQQGLTSLVKTSYWIATFFIQLLQRPSAFHLLFLDQKLAYFWKWGALGNFVRKIYQIL